VLGAVALVVPMTALVACGNKTVTPPEAGTVMFDTNWTSQPTEDKLSREKCQKLLDDAERLGEAIFQRADRSCTTAADCIAAMRSPIRNDCGSSFVNKNALAKVTQENDAQTKALATQFMQGGCMVTLALPMPSCMIPVPTCTNGVCAYRP
jgi:hypothetical protein